MKLLVTGGAGFIGSNFIEYIINNYAGYKIIILDALTYAGSLDNLKNVLDNPRITFVQGRIEDSNLVAKIVQGIDVVINFAAETHVDRSIVEPQVFLKTNVIGTQVLLDAARFAGVKLFYQISTDEVYGTLNLDSTDIFMEKSPLKPTSPYAASKAAADLLVLSYYRTYNLPVVISRCSNNYGPRQHPEKFIPTVILNALQNNPVPVYGDGCYVRDWLHVKDHCRAIDVIMHKGRVGQIYNIAAGNELLNIDLVRQILKGVGKPDDLIKFVQDRPAYDRRYPLSFAKLKKELNWSPEVSWEEGLRETIKWYAGRLKNEE